MDWTTTRRTEAMEKSCKVSGYFLWLASINHHRHHHHGHVHPSPASEASEAPLPPGSEAGRHVVLCSVRTGTRRDGTTHPPPPTQRRSLRNGQTWYDKVDVLYVCTCISHIHPHSCTCSADTQCTRASQPRLARLIDRQSALSYQANKTFWTPRVEEKSGLSRRAGRGHDVDWANPCSDLA
jgi:hypothetical protein